VDTTFPNSDVLTSRRFKQYTKPLNNPRILKSVQTRLFEFDTTLDLSENVISDFRPDSAIDGHMHSELYQLSRIISQISGEVLHLKTRYALENNDQTSHSLELWGKTAMLKASKGYGKFRPSTMRDHAKDALDYWSLP